MSQSHALEVDVRTARAGFYYGWVNVVVAAVAMVATLPGRTLGLGLVTEPLLAGLRMDRVDFALVNLVATLVGALFGLACGPLIDRFGSRVVLTAASLSLAGSVLWMANARGAVDLAGSMTLTRGLGQSALSVASAAVVGKWFVRRVNVAMAVYAAVVAVGFIAAIPGVQYAVAHAPWRSVWAGVGYALLFGMTPLALVLARATPESIGVPADHPELRPAPARPGDAAAPAALTLARALRTPAFWTFALAAAVFNLVFSGVALFSEAILKERGLHDEATFRAAMGVLAGGGILANFLGGYLAGRVPLHRLMAVGMMIVTASLVVLPFASSRGAVFVYASLMGVAGGVVTVVFFACWPRVFGRPHLGKIQGAAQGLSVVFSAAGPGLLALGERHQGSFSRTFLMMAPVVAAVAVACWVVRMPSSQGAEPSR